MKLAVLAPRFSFVMRNVRANGFLYAVPLHRIYAGASPASERPVVRQQPETGHEIDSQALRDYTRLIGTKRTRSGWPAVRGGWSEFRSNP